MLNATASPGCIAQPRIGNASRSASMSGTSSSVPSSNTSALPARNERGMNHAPLCVPATNSGVADRETGSSGIQNEIVWLPSMQ